MKRKRKSIKASTERIQPSNFIRVPILFTQTPKTNAHLFMSIARKVFESSYFQVLTNLIQRFLGIISTLILARILTPNDFGMIAILALCTNLIATLSDVGTKQYIIQKTDVSDADLNTAWSLNFLGKLAITSILWIAAPFIAELLEKPDLILPMRIISLSIPLRALSNPGFFILAKQLDYSKIFKLTLWQKFTSFTCVMALAVVAPSYWVIVAGDIVAALVFLLGSYALNTYRPQFNLIKFKEQWSFSQWSLLRGITGFCRSQTDMMIVTKAFSASALGGYHLLRDLALTPVITLLIPAADPLLAAIACSKGDNQLLKYRIRISIITLTSILLPLAVFIYGFSKPIVGTILGDQWLPQHQLLSVFSMMFFAYALHELLSNCFTALSKVKLLFYFDLVSTLVIVMGLIAIIGTDLFNFALVRGGIGLLITGILLFTLNTVTQFGLRLVVLNILPSSAASLVAYFCCQHLLKHSGLSFEHIFVELVFVTITFFGITALIYIPITRKFNFVFKENYSAYKMFEQNIGKLVLKIKSKC